MYKVPAPRARKDSRNEDQSPGCWDLLRTDRNWDLPSVTPNGHVPRDNHVPYHPTPKAQPKPLNHSHDVLETCMELYGCDVHFVTRVECLDVAVQKGGRGVCLFIGETGVCAECGKVL